MTAAGEVRKVTDRRRSEERGNRGSENIIVGRVLETCVYRVGQVTERIVTPTNTLISWTIHFLTRVA